LAVSEAKGKLDLTEFDIKPTELPQDLKFLDLDRGAVATVTRESSALVLFGAGRSARVS